MKNKKSLLGIFVLLLVVGVCVSTYAIYKSSATGTASINAAAWIVKVNNTDITETNTFSFSDITWVNTANGAVDGTIAPGSTGTSPITLDATGSEVPVKYTVSIGDVTDGTNEISNSNFQVSVKSGSSLTGTIATTGTRTATIELEVTWTGIDSSEANEADLGLAVTAEQQLN